MSAPLLRPQSREEIEKKIEQFENKYSAKELAYLRRLQAAGATTAEEDQELHSYDAWQWVLNG